MIVAVCLLAAALSAWLVWSGLEAPLSGERFLKQNFRGNHIPAFGGVAIVLVTTVGSVALLLAVPASDLALEASFAAFQLTVGFGVLGLVDDVLGQSSGGGFRGHLRALGNRRITTGLVKLIGGVAVAGLAAGLVADGGVVPWVRDTALIAGGANLANLFDRAPGRTLKVAIIAFAGLVSAAGVAATLSFAALGVGAALGISWWELREKVMLGDTGVNALGALVAFSAVMSLGSTALWATLSAVVALNIVSEFVSFSRAIDKVAALRAIDRLARPRP